MERDEIAGKHEQRDKEASKKLRAQQEEKE